MTNEELINYVLEGNDARFRRALEYWFMSQRRFKDFVFYHRDKIRKKIRGAKGSSLVIEDIAYELEVAFLLLTVDDFNVEYEKYDRGVRHPDFAITVEDSTKFNIEVKHLREVDLGLRFRQWTDKMGEKVKALPLGFLISFYIPLQIEDLDDPPKSDATLVPRLESLEENILARAETAINEYQSDRKDGVEFYSIPNLEGEMELVISKSSENPLAQTSLVSFSDPRFFGQDEVIRICDAICAKLGQMLPNMINILAIRSSGKGAELKHLSQAVERLNQEADQGNEQFFQERRLGSVGEYKERTKHLSGIWFRTRYITQWASDGVARKLENALLWCNESADQQIPEAVQRWLNEMPLPYSNTNQ